MDIYWVLILVAIFLVFQVLRWMFSPILTYEEEIEVKMEKFFKRRLPLGLPITKEEIIENVFGGRDAPILVKNDGRTVFLITEQWHNGWRARIFDDGKLYRSPTPEELRKKEDEFQKRVPIETLHIRSTLLEQTFSGVGVAEVGDLCWEPNTDHSHVLIAATLKNGKHVIVGYEDGVFSLLSSERGDYQMVLDNLQRRPTLEFDDGDINIHFAKDRQLLVQHHSVDYNNWKRGWNVSGFSWSGSAACKKFAEHGVSFSGEEVKY